MRLSQYAQWLGELGSWWGGQICSLFPGGAVRGTHAQDALIISIDRLAGESGRAEGALVLRRNGQEILLHPLDMDAPPPPRANPLLPTGLRLPAGAVLSREVTLPLAAARDLQPVLGFEMDRLTPFSADELYWSISRVTQDRGREKLSLRLSIVLREQVEALLEPLARLRLSPSFVEAGAERIELAAARRHPVRRTRDMLALVIAVLALACIAVPFIRQQLALNAASQAITNAMPDARAAMDLRRQLAATASGQAAIAEARRGGDALRVLAAVTDALPDGTWLSDLTLKSGDLTFDGQSQNAAQLIGLLSAVPGLRAPSFTAPVTRTVDGQADLFSLHATVAP